MFNKSRFIIRSLVRSKSRNSLIMLRFQSTIKTSSDLFNQRYETLQSIVSKDLQNEVPESKILHHLKTVKSFQDTINESHSDLEFDDSDSNQLYYSTNQLMKSLLNSSNLKLNEEKLQELFRFSNSELDQKLNVNFINLLISKYHANDSKATIPYSVLNIPFKRLLWDGQFHKALDLIESTASTQRYKHEQIEKIWKILGYSFGGTTGLITLAHIWISFRYPEIMHYGDYGIYGIYAAVVSYCVNCGFLASLAFSSKGLENGNLMYAKHTLPHNWFIKLNELKMCSKVVLADAEINGQEGFATREIISRVKELGFMVNEPEQEVMLRQYWYSSGEGFVWCEPDLDPAELIWWDHLHEVGVKTIWDINHEKIQEQKQQQQQQSIDEDADDELFLPKNNIE